MNISHPQQIALSVAFLLAFTACFERERSAPSENLSEIDSELTESAQENADDLNTEQADPVAEVPESDPAPETEPDPRAWQRLAVRQSEPDVLRERPLMGLDGTNVTEATPVAPVESNEGNWSVTDYVEPETDPACLFTQSARIAEVEIEGIVREYIPVLKREWVSASYPAVTVFRIRVIRTIHGRALPGIVYAAAQSATMVLRQGVESVERHPSSYLVRGMKGLATFYMMGYDPIRMWAAKFDALGETRWLPARVLGLGLVLPELEDGTWSSRFYPFHQSTLGESVGAEELTSYIARFPVLECNSSVPSPCTQCDTADQCSTEMRSCACVQGMVGCRELPPEEPDRCNLYPDTP